MLRTLIVLSLVSLLFTVSSGLVDAQIPSACTFSPGFDTPGVRFEEYVAGGQADPLPFVGTRGYGNGSVVNTGPCFADPAFFPYALHDITRDVLLLHPGTFATVNTGGALAYPVDRTGRFRLSGSFARANNFQYAANGVYVAVFINSDDAHPLFAG